MALVAQCALGGGPSGACEGRVGRFGRRLHHVKDVLKTERIISEGTARRVLLVTDAEGRRRAIRVIETDVIVGPDVVLRASALGLVRRVELPGFASVEGCSIVGGRIEIAEEYLEGFALETVFLSDAMSRLIAEHATFELVLSIVLDLAGGLAALHDLKERDGRAAKLIHGRLTASKVILSVTGEARIVGFEGLRGDEHVDIQAVIAFLRRFCAALRLSPEDARRLARIVRSPYKRCGDLRDEMESQLMHADRREIARARARLAERVLSTIHGPESVRSSRSTTRAEGGRVRPPSDLLLIEVDVEEVTATQVDRIHSPTSSIRETPAVMSGAAGSPAIRDALSDPTLPPAAAVLAPTAPSSALAPTSTPAPRPSSPPTGAPTSALPLRSRPSSAEASQQVVRIGAYSVVASIGRGGMGEIYLAKHEERPGFVALKVLSADGAADDEAIGMLMDEAAIMTRIHHPNVLRVIDYGRAPEGYYFLATEYLEGRPLARVMIDAYRRPAGMDYATIAALGVDAALGLFAAHTSTSERGEPLEVVHRDISPQNLFVTHAGLTKVLDFGVARASERISKTAVGIVKGKAAYMSPEQAEGSRVDARSDVFSLGTCLWEMAAGRRLFKRESEYETLLAVATGEIESPTHVRGRPDRALDAIILRALERNRRKRIQTARELADRLMDYCQKAGLAERREAVRLLMRQLFGDVAQEEQALMQRFEARVATQEESRALNRVSGVAPKTGRGSQLTLAAEPSGLLILDRFGEIIVPSGVGDRDTKSGLPLATGSAGHGSGTPSLGLGADEGADEDAGSAADAAGDLPAFDRDHELLQLVAGSAEVAPDAFGIDRRPTRIWVGDEDIEPLHDETPLPSGVESEDLLGDAVGFDVTASPGAASGEKTSEAFSVVAESPLARSTWSGEFEVEPSLGPDALALGFEGEDASNPSFGSADERPRSRRYGLIALGLLLAIGLGAGAALAFRAYRSGARFGLADTRDPPPSTEDARTRDTAADDDDGDDSAGAMGAGPAADGAAAMGADADAETQTDADTTARDVDRSVADRGTTDAEASAVGDGGAMSAVPSTVPSVVTSATTLEHLFGAMGQHRMTRSASDDRVLVADPFGGEVMLDRGASVSSVRAPSLNGYIVSTDAALLPAIAWIGSAHGSSASGSGKSAWRARSLSINDCRATVRVTDDAFVVTYAGAREVRLPLGGGALLDVAVTVPEDVVRIEVLELGLAFAPQDAAQSQEEAGRCASGWWGQRLVIRRLPPGRYTLRMKSNAASGTGSASGSASASTDQILDVTETSVRGGELVHADLPSP